MEINQTSKRKAKFAAQFARTEANKARKQEKIARKLAKAKARKLLNYGKNKNPQSGHDIFELHKEQRRLEMSEVQENIRQVLAKRKAGST